MSGKANRYARRRQFERAVSAGNGQFPPTFGGPADIQRMYRDESVRSGGVQVAIDTSAMVAHLNRVFARFPKEAERALKRATKKFRVVVRREALQAASESSGIAQKFFLKAFRFHVEEDVEGGELMGLVAWIGTDPIGVHRLGKVAWKPLLGPGSRKRSKGRPSNMAGARVGKRSYPGSWSWGRGTTGPAVMRRTGATRLPIWRVEEEPHPAVEERLRRTAVSLGERYHRLLKQQLNYAMNFEGRIGVHRRLLLTEDPA